MRTVALVLSALLAQATLASNSGRQAVYRARTDVVVIDVAVADGRKPVTNLTKDDFELRDNGVVQQILDFDRQRMPLDVTVTIDMSGSMNQKKREIVERALGQIGASLQPADRAAVVTFAATIAERTPLGPPPLVVDLSTPRGGTSVLDTLLLSLVTAPIVDRRQFSLFMTDGEDTTSYFDPFTVVETAKFANGQTSVVIVRDGGHLNHGAVLTAFRSVTNLSGGEMIELDGGDDLSQAFLTAVENFRTSYVLRYSPAGVPARGWHDVGVTLKSRNRNHTIRARRGYWSGPS